MSLITISIDSNFDKAKLENIYGVRFMLLLSFCEVVFGEQHHYVDSG